MEIRQEAENMYTFPVRFNGSEKLKYIFPSKQKDVQKAIEIAEKNEKIRRMIIFGSAVTMNCGIGSDIDIAIDAPDIKDDDEFITIAKPFRKALESEIDIIHLNSTKNDLLRNEILTKGVDVYVNWI